MELHSQWNLKEPCLDTCHFNSYITFTDRPGNWNIVHVKRTMFGYWSFYISNTYIDSPVNWYLVYLKGTMFRQWSFEHLYNIHRDTWGLIPCLCLFVLLNSLFNFNDRMEMSSATLNISHTINIHQRYFNFHWYFKANFLNFLVKEVG